MMDFNFLAFDENLDILVGQIISVHSELKLTPKPVMLLNAGADKPDTKTSLPLDQQVEETAITLRKLKASAEISPSLMKETSLPIAL